MSVWYWKAHSLNIYLWVLKTLKNGSIRGCSGGGQLPPSHSHVLLLTCNCCCVKTVSRSTERRWNNDNKDFHPAMAEWEKQFFTCDGSNVNNGAFPAEPLCENKTLSQIYLNSFIYCFFCSDIWLGYRNRMQIKSPWPFFIWLWKRCCRFTIGKVLFVLFFFVLFAESGSADCCWQVISHSLWELIAARSQHTGSVVTGETSCEGTGGVIVACLVKILLQYQIKGYL